ncbi:hypothetical protein FSP39_023787 [Pinctada imbricata]|uniref:XK-related protein n=1 Tax=Pinctada imbricata TaxID=66713 RepID=A0AA89BV15_PINIB|nr:hypothetical protein FSP39_023787 [Pinctada imbricata]
MDSFDCVDGGPHRNTLPNHYIISPGEDDVDGGSTEDWNPKIHKRHVFFAFLSLFTFGFDYGTDIGLLVEYYNSREMVLFYVSLSFIAVPSLVSGILSIIWYIMDHSNNSGRLKKQGTFVKRLVTTTKISLCFLQLGRFTR